MNEAYFVMKSYEYKDKKWLYDNYINGNRTSVEIATECGVSPSTVRISLKKNGIPIRPRGSYRNLGADYKDKDWLYNMYIVEQRGSYFIAELCGVSPPAIRYWLFKYDIVGRTNREAQLIAIKNNRFPKGHFDRICRMSGGNCTVRSDETRQKVSMNRKGKCMGVDHPHWNNGSSFEPYGIEFNNELKEKVRKRDGYVCCVCGVTQEEEGYALSVHHIDYDKKNNEESNLVSLCKSHHAYTNHNRDFWISYFSDFGGIYT